MHTLSFATNGSVMFFIVYITGRYRQISNVRRTKSQNLNVARLVCVIYWSQVLSREWIGAALVCDAPTTTQWPTILLATEMSMIDLFLLLFVACPMMGSLHCFLTKHHDHSHCDSFVSHFDHWDVRRKLSHILMIYKNKEFSSEWYVTSIISQYHVNRAKYKFNVTNMYIYI